MPLRLNWDGTILTAPTASSERTTKLGTFQGKNGIRTYYPLALSHNQAVDTVGYYTVPAEFEGRPDLIANAVYNDTDLWWVVLWASNIIDPFNRPATNEVIRLVDITQVRSLI